MIRIIAALSIAILFSTANAAPNDSGCRSFMTTAEIIMSSRQSGVSLSDSLMILDRNFTNPESTAKREAVKQIVLAAYQEPYYHTDEMKDVSINEFAALHYMACLELNRK